MESTNLDITVRSDKAMTTTSKPTRTYRERREARAERLRQWAAKRETRAEQAAASVDTLTSLIPLGQPILRGHHSQRRAERDRDRIVNGTRRVVEHSNKAREFTSRAANIEAAAEHAIYSDDADAITRLTERIAGLERERDTIKTYNAACRKGTAHPATLPDNLARELASSIRVWGDVQCPGGRFPSYTLRNLSGNINRNKRRLAVLAAGESQ
jgi:hypothetical protein